MRNKMERYCTKRCDTGRATTERILAHLFRLQKPSNTANPVEVVPVMVTAVFETAVTVPERL